MTLKQIEEFKKKYGNLPEEAQEERWLEVVAREHAEAELDHEEAELDRYRANEQYGKA